MFGKYPFAYIISSIILFFVLACVMTPAGLTQVPEQPVSTTNPDLFATMVAEASGALLTQTAEAAALVSSPTPDLLSPNDAPLTAPTETPVTSLAGTSLSRLEDGSTQFIDTIAGISLTIPAGWLVMRLNEPEFYQVWELTVDDPILQSDLEGILNLDPAQYRLHAFNTQPDYVYQGEGSKIIFIFVRDDVRTLEQIAEDEKQPEVFTEYALISSEFQVRSDGLQLFMIEEQWQGTSSTNEQVMIYDKSVIFKVQSGTVMIDLFVPANISYEVIPAFDQMIEQMTPFIP